MYDCIKSNCQYCGRYNVQTIEDSCRQCWNAHRRKHKNNCDYCWCEDHTIFVKIGKWLFRLCSGCHKSHSHTFISWVNLPQKKVSFTKNQVEEYELDVDESYEKRMCNRQCRSSVKYNRDISILVKYFYRNHFMNLPHAEQVKLQQDAESLKRRPSIYKRRFLARFYSRFNFSGIINPRIVEEGYETVLILAAPVEKS